MTANNDEEVLKPVLRFLLGAGQTTPNEVAAQLGLSQPTASRRLNALVQLGLASRRTDGRQRIFEPRESLRVSWVGHDADKRAATGPAKWLHLEWSSEHAVDWRYPLVTQLPDAAAQTTVTRFLETLGQRGVFTPWLALDEPTRRTMTNGIDDLAAARRAQERLSSPEPWTGFTTVVYGSCARGDARRESDVDVLVIGPSDEVWNHFWQTREGAVTPFRWEDWIADAADTVNIGSPRTIDILYAQESAVVDLPPRLLEAIRRDGRTVHCTEARPAFMEGWRPE